MTKQSLYHSDLITTKQLSLEDIDAILTRADELKNHPQPKLLENSIIAHCFFEPSTRTKLSFESASLKLGAKNIGFSNAENLSTKKGESLQDTIQVISGYADLIVIRHPLEGSAALAAQIAECPVINAGDGANQHPTQALLDLYSIKSCQGQINGLSIALAGDLKYGRTIHSLAQLCSLYDVRLYLVSPESLHMPQEICDHLKKSGIRFSFHESLADVINKVDILYMTRIQHERFAKSEYELVKNQMVLLPELLKKAKSNLKILHPLPRLHEIPQKIDSTPFAYYFQQAQHGVDIRQAILSLILHG